MVYITYNGVCSFSFVVLTSAPAFNNSVTTSKCPEAPDHQLYPEMQYSQATIKGVQPILSLISISAELERRSWTIPKLEVVDAQCRGVRPS
jgi:hypothetical protein